MRATSSGIVVVAALVATIALGGCHATTYSAEPVGYVELTAAPFDAELYPHTYYEGRVVYYVNDRWMYLDRGRWAYYQREPPALYRHRTYIQQAPPVYPRRYPQQYPQPYPQRYPQPYPQQYPQPYPQYYPGGPPPAGAPPAVRVR